MKNERIIIDGKIGDLKDEEGLLNRGLFLGESPFTCFIARNGKISFLGDHLLRLQKGIDYLYPDVKFNVFALREQIELSVRDMATNHGHLYVRLTFFQLLNGKLKYFLYMSDIDPLKMEMKICLAAQRRGETLFPSFLKIGQYMEQNLLLKQVKQEGFDEVINCNFNGEVLEASTANLFFVIDEIVVTPKIIPGILEGVTRFHLLNCLRESGIAVKEKVILAKELHRTSEIWATNSRGIRYATHFGNRECSGERFFLINQLFDNYEKVNDDKKTRN